MSLAPPERVRKLQATLHAKAKGSPGYRFYLLYDKVHRRDILAFAYARCRSNGGVAGLLPDSVLGPPQMAVLLDDCQYFQSLN